MKMNGKQKIILALGVILIILSGLFPPWTNTFKQASIYSETPADYSFIFDPPRKWVKTYGVKLDIERLSVQWIIIIIGTGAGILLVAPTKKE